MALRWEWKNKVGTCTVVGSDNHMYTVDLYIGNAYLIEIWENEKEQTYSLAGFYADKEHMKRCLGLSKGYDSIYTRETSRYYTFYRDKLSLVPKDLIPSLLKGYTQNITVTICNSEKGEKSDEDSQTDC